jgi:hypothetical protein
VDNGSSRHMTRMRSMFLSVSETYLDYHVDCGTSAMHAVKGVRCVKFQLESRESLEVAEVLFVPELKVSFLSVSTLEDERYGVVFEHGNVFIYLEGLPWMQQQCLVSNMGDYTGCWDNLCVSPRGSWIQDQFQ